MTRVVALAGGVGGAKLADGLQAHIGAELTVVVNTGDDCWRHGLLVMPDHDTVLYNLAGIEQVEWGWGIEGDTHATMAQLGVYGEETWFGLGDRDLALHIVAHRAAPGRRAADRGVPRAAAVARDRGPDPADERRRRSRPRSARPTAGSSSRSTSSTSARRRTCSSCGSPASTTAEPDARGPRGHRAAEAIVIAPSNPLVSVAPILDVPGLRDAIDAARARGVPVAAVSPIIGGQGAQGARGPDARRARPRGVGPRRRPPVRGARRHLRARHGGCRRWRRHVEALGLRPVVTDTIMRDDASRARLAGEVLAASPADVR